MRILFLDDKRNPRQILRPVWAPFAVIARTVEQALEERWEIYELPTCFKCLPPPEPLKINVPKV